MLLSAEHLSMDFGDRKLLEDVQYRVRKMEIELAKAKEDEAE